MNRQFKMNPMPGSLIVIGGVPEYQIVLVQRVVVYALRDPV